MEFKQAPYVERIKIKLNKEDKKKLVGWIDQERSQMEQDRTEFVARQESYLYNWDDFITFNRKGPWEGASNLHMPLTAIMVKSYFSRLYNIFSDPTTVQIIPREGTDETHVQMIRMLRKWYMWDYLNGYRGIKGFIREIFQDVVTVGYGIGIKDWIIKQRKVIDIAENELKREMDDLGARINQVPHETMETEEETDQRSVDVSPYKEVQKILTVFEGTRLRSIPFEDVYFPENVPESNHLDGIPCLDLIQDVSISELRMRGKQGEWDEKALDKIIDKNIDGFHSAQSQGIKDRRSAIGGTNKIDQWEKEIKRLEYAFCTYDIDDDGIAEEIVVTKCDREILKVTYLDRISPLGMRPVFKFDCFTKPRNGYSRGLPEYMYSLNEEMDQHHNMRIDYMGLQTVPFGVYRASSSLKNQPIRIAPGKFIPVDEVTDMKPFTFSANAGILAGEEDRIWHYAERLAASSSVQQGIVPETVGPLRSTSGVVSMLREMEKEFKPMLEHNAMEWKRLEKMVLCDLDYRIPAQMKMRVLGASIEEYIDPQNQKAVNEVAHALRINALFDMELDVANLVTSEEAKRQESSMILTQILAPSIAQQMGIIGPKALFKVHSDYLRAFGKEPDAYLDKPQFISQPLTLYQEIQICGQGELPPMAMTDDHQAKAQMLIQFTQRPELQEMIKNGIVVPHVQEVMMKAAQKHMMLMQAMQPKGQPNPTGMNQNNMMKMNQGGPTEQEQTEETPNEPEETEPGNDTETPGVEGME